MKEKICGTWICLIFSFKWILKEIKKATPNSTFLRYFCQFLAVFQHVEHECNEIRSMTAATKMKENFRNCRNILSLRSYEYMNLEFVIYEVVKLWNHEFMKLWTPEFINFLNLRIFKIFLEFLKLKFLKLKFWNKGW